MNVDLIRKILLTSIVWSVFSTTLIQKFKEYKIPKEINLIEENKIIEIKEYKFSFIAEKTAIYKIKLNKGEQLIIK